MDFTYIDAIVAGIVVLSGLLASARGLVREVMAIAGWIAAGLLAFVLAPLAAPLVSEVPVLGEALGGSCELRVIVAFAAVFALGLLVMAAFTPLLSSSVQRSALNGPDRALGFLFGVLRGIVLVAVAFVVYERAAPEGAITVVDRSRSAVAFDSLAAEIEARLPTTAPAWMVSRYEGLVGACGA